MKTTLKPQACLNSPGSARQLGSGPCNGQKHLENLSLTSFHIETFSTMLGVVENNNTGGDDNLVTRLHGRPFKSGDCLTESQAKTL